MSDTAIQIEGYPRLIPRIGPVRELLRRGVELWPFARGAWRMRVVAATLFRSFDRSGAIGSAGISNVVFPYPPGWVSSETFWLLYEKEIRRLMKTILAPGSIFVDIGAHRGFHSSLALGLVHPGGHVLACEPCPQNALGLRILARLNPDRKLVIEESAIAGRTDRQVLYLSDDDGWNTLIPEFRERYPAPFAKEPKTCTVATLSLDDLFDKHSYLGLYDASRRLVIKVDIEAAEYEILKHSHKVLGLPNIVGIILECSGGPTPFFERAIECVRILGANGFNVSVITPTAIRPWRPEDARRQVNLLASRS